MMTDDLHVELWRNPHAALSSANDTEIDAYTRGMCHIFAVALHRLTGWTMHIVLDEGEPWWSSETDSDDYIASVVHVLCEDDQSQFWDVRGMRPAGSLFDEMTFWATISQYSSDKAYSEGELEMYCGCWGEPEEIDRPLTSITEEEIAEAENVVRRVLEGVPGFTAAAPEMTL